MRSVLQMYMFLGLPALLALVAAPSVKLKLRLCEEHLGQETNAQRRLAMLPALVIVQLLVLIIGTLSRQLRDNPILFVSIWIFVTLLSVMLAALILKRLPVTKRTRDLLKIVQIDRHFVWVDGVHPDYLARLPEASPPS